MGDRSKLAQAPHRPSAPRSSSVAKSAANQNALHGVSLAPMRSTDSQETTKEKTSTTEGSAWRTPRVDGEMPANLTSLASPSSHEKEQQDAKPKTARPGETTMLKPAPPPSNNGAQTSRPSVRISSTEESGAHSSTMEVVGGPFNVEHTSSKPLENLLVEIKRVLNQAVVKYNAVHKFQFVCHKQNTRFKLEICELENVKKVHLVRCTRLAGDAWSYKQISKTIMANLNL